jgi:hypothetical protein
MERAKPQARSRSQGLPLFTWNLSSRMTTYAYPPKLPFLSIVLRGNPSQEEKRTKND